MVLSPPFVYTPAGDGGDLTWSDVPGLIIVLLFVAWIVVRQFKR